MITGTTVFSIFLAFLVVLLQQTCAHQRSSYPLSSSFDDRQIFRHPNKDEASVAFPRLTSDLFGSRSDDSSDSSKFQEENDSSLSSDEVSMYDLPIGHSSQVMKRRKGPTLSVVNPLEILRQRLMLDLARRRIHENQKQIVANEKLLEGIGKRSVMGHSEEMGNLRDGSYQP